MLALLSGEWALMSDEERTAATAGRQKEIAEDKVTRLTGENNAGIAAFHDAAGVFRSIENQVCHYACRD